MLLSPIIYHHTTLCYAGYIRRRNRLWRCNFTFQRSSYLLCYKMWSGVCIWDKINRGNDSLWRRIRSMPQRRMSYGINGCRPVTYPVAWFFSNANRSCLLQTNQYGGHVIDRSLMCLLLCSTIGVRGEYFWKLCAYVTSRSGMTISPCGLCAAELELC
jgi:hypothetical protein